MLVLGASGLVGQAAAAHFASLPGWKVTAVSRRRPQASASVRHLALDLADGPRCAAVLGRLPNVTHVVFAAYAEEDGTQGWREPAQMDLNLRMLRNALEPLLARRSNGQGALRHVTLLQGTKAYGAPHAAIPLPAREDAPRAAHAAFYFPQEDWLRAQHAAQAARTEPWHWTILRPQVVFGESLGSHMNMMPALGVYAALLASRGEPLYFPGGATRIREAVDAGLLARACAWAATSPACRNEIFNITNGDVFDWRSLWPAIADAFGMPAGGDRPLALAQAMPPREAEWAALVQLHGLTAPASLRDFVGQGFAYADRQLCTGLAEPPPPRLVSTIKARQAGFADCMDTEAMFRASIDRMRSRGWLPPCGVHAAGLVRGFS